MKVLHLHWQGGEHDFLLPLGQIEAVQEACDAGIETVLGRLRSGEAYASDILSPIRLGLIGAGKSADEANKVVKKTVDSGIGLGQLKPTAMMILSAVLWGVGDDPVGELSAVETPLTS